VPTFVSADTFCASRKDGLSAMRAWLTLIQSTTLPSTQLKFKQIFSYCDQIKFNEPVLKPEILG